MRGPDEQTNHMFSYLSPEQRVRADHPLRAIRAMTDRVFADLSPRFTKMYSDIGRPSIPPEQLLRALVLQSLYTVRSERLLMEEIDYSVLYRWLVGFSMDDPISARLAGAAFHLEVHRTRMRILERPSPVLVTLLRRQIDRL